MGLEIERAGAKRAYARNDGIVLTRMQPSKDMSKGADALLDLVRALDSCSARCQQDCGRNYVCAPPIGGQGQVASKRNCISTTYRVAR